MAKNGVKTKIDIAILQEQVTEIRTDVKSILGNHLPHLHEEIDSIRIKTAYYSGGLAVLVILLNLFARYFVH